MAAEFARTYTWVVVADEELRSRTEALATEHDLLLIRANLAFLSAFVTITDLGGFAVASELFDAAGSPRWGPLARTIGVRWAAATGQLPDAEELLAAERHVSNDFTRVAIVGAAAQVALVRGELSGTARWAQEELAALRPPNSTTMPVFTHVAYESVARVAFFSGERDVLEWAAAALSEGSNSKNTRRLATVAGAHLSVLEDVSPAWPVLDSSLRDRIVDSTLRDRIVGSVTRGGLIQRETPYLAIAAGDPDWIAAERSVIEPFAADNDQRAHCFMSLADAVLALLGGDTNAAERHWHDLLAVSSQHGFGLLWIDALEGLAICAMRAGASDEAARLAGAAQSARHERGYRYRYPHLGELPSGSDEGRALSLEEATAYARRSRGQRVRPATGWAALTPTEAEVARAVADGLTNQQAAARLFMSVPTVKTLLRHIFAKLEIDNRSQLVAEVAKNQR
jgi:DNA-binding CsgD family transcriptional regulator